MTDSFIKRLLIKDCLEKVGQEVAICGFLQTVRKHGKITFVDIADRSGIVQVVFVGEDVNAHPQDAVLVKGKVNKRPEHMVNKNIPTGAIEIAASGIEILSKSQELPFDMGGFELDLQLPTLLDFRSLTLRHPRVKAIFKVQAALLKGFRQAAEKLGCTEIVVPTIAASATEGGAEVFLVDYYKYKAYLTQSPQLYKQMMVPVFERVYTIAHAYRAEPSVTTRHLSESTQLDCELGFMDFPMLLDCLEQIASDMLKYAEGKCTDELASFGAEKLQFGKIPSLTLREAQEIIFKETGRDNRLEKDLAPQDEIDICKWALKNHGSDLVIITHFPTAKRAFYTMPDPKNPEYSLSYDILFRGLEIASGSQRIHEYNQLVEAIKGRGLDPKNFELYLQAFKYGMPQEGGFSFGLERITMHMLGLSNVREASLFPRDMERVDQRLSLLHEKKTKTK